MYILAFLIAWGYWARTQAHSAHGAPPTEPTRGVLRAQTPHVASGSPSPFFYSIETGPVHSVFLSNYHDYTAGSDQARRRTPSLLPTAAPRSVGRCANVVADLHGYIGASRGACWLLQSACCWCLRCLS